MQMEYEDGGGCRLQLGGPPPLFATRHIHTSAGHNLEVEHHRHVLEPQAPLALRDNNTRVVGPPQKYTCHIYGTCYYSKHLIIIDLLPGSLASPVLGTPEILARES